MGVILDKMERGGGASFFQGEAKKREFDFPKITGLPQDTDFALFENGFIAASNPTLRRIYSLHEITRHKEHRFGFLYRRFHPLKPFLELSLPPQEIPPEQAWGFVDFPEFVFGYRPLSLEEKKERNLSQEQIKFYFKFKNGGNKHSGFQKLQKDIKGPFVGEGLRFFQENDYKLSIYHPFFPHRLLFLVTPFYMQALRPQDDVFSFGSFVLCERNEGRVDVAKNIKITHTKKRMTEIHDEMKIQTDFLQQDYNQKIKIENYGLVYASEDQLHFIDKETDEIFKVNQKGSQYEYNFASRSLLYKQHGLRRSITLNQLRHPKNRVFV